MLGCVRRRLDDAEFICFKAGILRDMGASREPLQPHKNHAARMASHDLPARITWTGA
jgi:hypothetical protein